MSEVAVGTDNAPTAGEVGNHHWPHVSNYFAEHGAQFLEHHDHRDPNTGTLLELSELRSMHHQTRFHKVGHDKTAMYHVPKEVSGCRSPRGKG